MKKTITLLLLIFSFQTTKAQFVTIPDANFVTWLQANVPSAMSGNQMDTTSLAVTTRTLIEVEDLGIADLSGVQYFDSLKSLDCGNGFVTTSTPNTLSNLPTLPSTLDSLICGRNMLTTLPVLPTTLKLLKCYTNLLSSLPLLTNMLTYLNCSDNQISSLPIPPNSLVYLDCSGNPLGTISVLPNNLNEFHCNADQLVILPALTNSLVNLSCTSNSITTLPVLPNSIQYLNCSNNQLTNIPTLPNNLLTLDCVFNQLTSLPALPITLTSLNCWNNQLTSLPTLNCPLWGLWCFDNQLTSLPVLPPTLHSLKCDHNSITCFAPFTNSIYSMIDISNNPFTCLPNYVYVMDAATLNYPLCISGNTVTNPNGCPDATGIVGFTYKDNNTNCLKDAGDMGLKNIPLQLYDNGGNFLSQTYTALNGVYQFLQNANTYTVSIDTTWLPFMESCIYPGLDSTVTVAILDTNINFALTCKPGFDVGIQSIVANGIVFPGQNHVLNINAGDITHWYNLSCAAGVSGTLSFSVNGPVTYMGPAVGALTPNIVGNVYTYTISDFGTINNTTDFALIFQTLTTAQTGDMICVNATVTPISGDNNPTNNTYTTCYNVVNSHDPNIKEVYPVEVQTNFNDWLTYSIHFQNTGNAAAINIRLEDQLDSKLDPETFQLINYSHYNVIDVTGNHLTVRFPNIQLADSTSNAQGSIGFVQYRVKPKANWVTDTIRNSAEIYFDYNTPIVTNTAKSYFMTTTEINDISDKLGVMSLVPNPTNGILTITSRYDFDKIELLNITGQVLLSEQVNSKEHQLQLQNFAEGIYFVKTSYKDGRSITQKVIKQ
jgi:uncharacterized repeat protein (TIGR01451 family)